MSNDIVQYGPDDYLPTVATMERITNHLKTALKADGAPTNQLLNAARVCAKFNLEPAQDVHLYSAFGNNWTLDIGVRAYQKSADRWERETGDKLIFGETRLLEPDEMKRELKEQFVDGETVGVMVSCVKLSAVQTFKSLDLPVPFQHYTGYHFGSRGGRTKSGWYSDKKPGATESYEGQARRRAKKKAYMNEIGLMAPPVTQRAWQVLDDNLESQSRIEAQEIKVNAKPIAMPVLERDEDGDVVFAAVPKKKPAPVIDGEIIGEDGPADANEPFDKEQAFAAIRAEVSAEVEPVESLADAPADTAAAIVTPALPDPPTFGTVKKAMEWAVEWGAYDDTASAKAVYNELKAELKPSNAGEMYSAWIAHCRRTDPAGSLTNRQQSPDIATGE